MSINEVFRAQAQFQESLLAKPNVVGVAVGRKNETGELAVVTLVEQKLPLAALSADAVVPKQIDGVVTDVVEVGYLRAYDSPRDRFRPTIPSGVSIGHFKITAGTLGTIVTDTSTGEKLILSNNHVMANSNMASLGDPILQPGPTDGGHNPGDMVARLERFVQIHFIGDPEPPPPTPTPPGPTPTPGGCDIVSAVVGVTNALASLAGSKQRVTTTGVQAASVAMPSPVAAPISAQAIDNEVDAALAKPVDPNMFTGDILGIGQVSGTKAATLGMKVRKSGRTTGYTEGTVNLLNATVSVAYGSKTARFTGQIITSPMSQGGDSGSLIVDGTENKAVGLLFAGSNLSTIFNPIDKVLAALNITI
ncbi:MAG: S1 family peptidase [Anaerolineae bacterium]|nr:S1 family peptidase [Anaerolineae bacterium]